MSWGSIFLVIAAVIFFALAINIIPIVSKGIDWNFLAHFFLCLGLVLGAWALPITWHRNP